MQRNKYYKLCEQKIIKDKIIIEEENNKEKIDNISLDNVNQTILNKMNNKTINVNNLIFKYNLFKYSLQYNDYELDKIEYMKDIINLLYNYDDINYIKYNLDNILEKTLEDLILYNKFNILIGGVLDKKRKKNIIYYIKKEYNKSYEIYIINTYEFYILKLSNVKADILYSIFEYNILTHNEENDEYRRFISMYVYSYNSKEKNERKYTENETSIKNIIDKYKIYM